jgi:hypothetical protein
MKDLEKLTLKELFELRGKIEFMIGSKSYPKYGLKYSIDELKRVVMGDRADDK